MGINYGRLSKTQPSLSIWIESCGDTCWYIPTGEDCWPDYTYNEGLGGPYYECVINAGSVLEMENKLAYYKKGEERWGTPYVILDYAERINKPEFDLYPNPVNDRLFIKTIPENIPYSFTLWDLTGKLIFESIIEATDYCLTDFLLIDGFYYYRIIDKSGRIKTGK